MEGDTESNFAYYALHKLNIRPSEWANMDMREKAFIIASIELKALSDEHHRKELEKESKS